jgi:hypothetical protein
MKKVLLSASLIASLFTPSTYAANSAHGFKQNVVGIFAGITDGTTATEPTFGVEYEFRFTKEIGVGAVWEKTPEGHDDHHGHFDDISVYLVSAYWHISAVRLGLGVGEEKVHGAHSHKEDLIRLSAAYDFHLTDSIGVAPTFNLDRVNGHNISVYGVVLNYAF